MQAWDCSLCSNQFLLPCSSTAAQTKAGGEEQRSHHKDCHDRNKTRNALLTCCVDVAAHTYRGITTSMCDALEFIPASPVLCALACPRHGMFLAHTGHGSFPSAPHRSCAGGKCQLPSALSACLGSAFSGNSTRVADASLMLARLH